MFFLAVLIHQVVTGRTLSLPPWQPVAPLGNAARKRELARYRRETVLPAIRKSSGLAEKGAPLPWAWIAASGDTAFPRAAFDLWWQLRMLGTPHPRWSCPWCGTEVPCTSVHLRLDCPMFAYLLHYFRYLSMFFPSPLSPLGGCNIWQLPFCSLPEVCQNMFF